MISELYSVNINTKCYSYAKNSEQTETGYMMCCVTTLSLNYDRLG